MLFYVLRGIVTYIIISPKEVFGNIMVLALSPRPPVDHDDVNTSTRKIFNLSLSNFICGYPAGADLGNCGWGGPVFA